MEIKFSKPDVGSLCYRYTIQSDGKLNESDFRTGDSCHGRPSCKEAQTTRLLFQYDKVVVTEDEFSQWIDFCNSIGFPCKYSIEDLNVDLKYDKIIGKFYCVDLVNDDYNSQLYLFAAVTIIRMISYRARDGRFVKESQSVITNLCNLIKNNPNEDKLKLLLLAHKDVEDYNHFLISKHYNISTFDVPTMIDTLKSNNYGSLNSVFAEVNPINPNSFNNIIW